MNVYQKEKQEGEKVTVHFSLGLTREATYKESVGLELAISNEKHINLSHKREIVVRTH